MTDSSTQPALRVVLTDVNERVVEAWRAAFADTPAIEIHRGSILDEDVDAWVTPTNSRGRMDGGVDAVIKRHLGSGIQVRVQRAIRDRFAYTLPVGSAVCVPSGATVPRYLISTPTMVRSSQNVSATLNVALACAAAFQAVHRQNRKAPGSIRSVALVGMGAQTGQVAGAGVRQSDVDRLHALPRPLVRGRRRTARHDRHAAERHRERAGRGAGAHRAAEGRPGSGSALRPRSMRRQRPQAPPPSQRPKALPP